MKIDKTKNADSLQLGHGYQVSSCRSCFCDGGLPLGPDAMPFALVGDEQNFGPDDWAWLFLSMNPEYRDAYAEHAEGNGPQPYQGEKIGAPPPNKAPPGRANKRREVVLYVADEEE